MAEKKKALSDIIHELMKEYGSALVTNEVDAYNRIYLKKFSFKLIELFISRSCLSCILLQFLDMPDIMQLDSAILNHSLRLDWLTTIRNCGLNENIIRALKADNVINWCAAKNIRFKAVRIHTYYTRDILTNVGLLTVAEYCKNLIKLELTNLPTSSVEGVLAIAKSCPNLQLLRSKESLCDESLKCFATNCVNLTDIYIRDLKANVLDSIQFSGDRIRSLTSNCRHLKTFYFQQNVGHAMLYSEDTITAFNSLSQCTLLESIIIANVPLSEDFLNFLAKACKSLKTIDLDNIVFSNNSLKDLGDNCHLLEHVVLTSAAVPVNTPTRYNGQVFTDDGIKNLALGCPLLHTLNIEATTGSQVKDAGVIALCQNCPLLSTVTFFRYAISPVVYSELGKLQHLKSLTLHYNPSISDESIINLVQNNQSLEYFSVKSRYNFSEVILTAIANNCTNLKQLFLYSYALNPNLSQSPAAIENLISQCKHLTSVFVKELTLSESLKSELSRRQRNNRKNKSRK